MQIPELFFRSFGIFYGIYASSFTKMNRYF